MIYDYMTENYKMGNGIAEFGVPVCRISGKLGLTSILINMFPRH